MPTMTVFSTFFFVLSISLLQQAFSFCGDRRVHTNLTRAVVRSSDWLRRYYKDGSSYMTPSLASSIIVSLRLSGHQPDVLLSEFKNNRSLSIEETLKEYLDEQEKKHGSLRKICPAELASIINAVIAVCDNPREFFGYDLYKTLKLGLRTFKRSTVFNNYFQYSLTVIALCNGGIDVPNFAIDELLRGARKYYNTHANDIKASLLTALSCVKKSYRRVEIRIASEDLIIWFIRNQNFITGAFGNQYSTALAAEALLAAGVSTYCWYCKKAMRNILSYQDDEGSFGTVLANIQITPSLLGVSLTALGALSCPKPKPTDTPTQSKKNITVHVNLVLDDTINPVWYEPAVTVTVPEGTTAYQILELAKEQNSCYTAVYKRVSWGRSVRAICGVVRKTRLSLYWMIYVDGSSAQYGVDGLKPKDGARITFKYQKVSI